MKIEKEEKIEGAAGRGGTQFLGGLGSNQREVNIETFDPVRF